MTEKELRRLKDLPVPAPREGAREAAVAAALAAFEAVAVPDAGAPQGSAVPPRLRNTSSFSEGRAKMRFRRPVAIAASIAVLALAAPFALHLVRTAPQQQDRVASVAKPPEPPAPQVSQPPARDEQDKLAALPKPAPAAPPPTPSSV